MHLGQFLRQLTRLAEEFGIAVVITNQVKFVFKSNLMYSSLFTNYPRLPCATHPMSSNAEASFDTFLLVNCNNCFYNHINEGCGEPWWNELFQGQHETNRSATIASYRYYVDWIPHRVLTVLYMGTLVMTFYRRAHHRSCFHDSAEVKKRQRREPSVSGKQLRNYTLVNSFGMLS